MACPFAGRCCVTVPSLEFATHTSRESTATPAGPFPTGIVLTTGVRLRIDLRDRSVEAVATQTNPPPKAIPAGPFPTWIVWITTRFDGIDPSRRCAHRRSRPRSSRRRPRPRSAMRRTGICPVGRPLPGWKIPTESAETAAAWRGPEPPRVSRMTAAIPATSAAAPATAATASRACGGRGFRPAVRSGGNSDGNPSSDKLVDPLRPVDVLQLLLAQVAQASRRAAGRPGPARRWCSRSRICPPCAAAAMRAPRCRPIP